MNVKDGRSTDRPALVCDGVTKVYDRAGGWGWRHAIPTERRRLIDPVVALQDVDLVVPPGQALGIIGPNGAGKSTLLKVVAGITGPTEGSVSVAGAVTSIIELGVGFHPELTGAENAVCAGVMQGLDPNTAKAAVDRIATFAGLVDAMDRPVKQYSLGMRARLAFAVATDRETDVLAVDEVLAVGDRDFQARCIDRVTERREAGTTLLFVSHELAVVAQMCERVVQFRHGRIVDDGPAGEVIERYLSSSATRLRTTAEHPVDVRHVEVPQPLRVGDPISVAAEIDVREPILEPSIGVDVSLPMVYPGLNLISSIEPVAPIRSSGRYRLRAVGSPVCYAARNVRFQVTIVDRARQRTVGSGSVDVASIGEERTAALGPIGATGVLPIEWSMELRPSDGPDLHPPRTSGAAPADAAISVRGLRKGYRSRTGRGAYRAAVPGNLIRARPDVVALDGVDLDISAGECVGIIGPNAAGKTTLLKVLAGITQPDAGSISMTGGVAGVFDMGPGLHPELTGRESIWSIARLHGLASLEIAELIDPIVEFSGIGEALDTPIKKYSTGMRNRLGFSIALHVPADVLMLDELLAVGDEDFRRSAMRAVRERNAAGTTVLFVSHELQLIEQLCRRVVRLDRGRVVDDGPTEDVLASYAGRSWAGGVSDGSGGVRLLPMSVRQRHVPIGETIDMTGDIVVDEPAPGARLEFSLRAEPPDRTAAMTVQEREAMSSFTATVVEAGAELTRPGSYSYSCSVSARELVGNLNAVLSVIDERGRTALAECWQLVTLGDPEPNAVPTFVLDLAWTIDPISTHTAADAGL